MKTILIGIAIVAAIVLVIWLIGSSKSHFLRDILDLLDNAPEIGTGDGGEF